MYCLVRSKVFRFTDFLYVFYPVGKDKIKIPLYHQSMLYFVLDMKYTWRTSFYWSHKVNICLVISSGFMTKLKRILQHRSQGSIQNNSTAQFKKCTLLVYQTSVQVFLVYQLNC